MVQNAFPAAPRAARCGAAVAGLVTDGPYPGPVLGRKDKPLLAIDIDGVISLFGFEEGEQPAGQFHLIDGMPHYISIEAGDRIKRLLKTYEGVWASGWEDRANDHLPLILGVPEMPHLTFDGRAQFGTAHWKLEAIDEYAGDRPLAWIDDSLDRSCRRWAKKREAPTLLVPTESKHGLEEAHVEALLAWVDDDYTPA